MAATLSTNSNTFNFQVNHRKVEYLVAETPTPHEIRPLSDIDDYELLRCQIPSILLFPVPMKREYSDIVKTIKRGITKALVFYYPFAGRIVEGPNRKLMVDCNNQGIVFIEADADLKLEQIGSGILSINSIMEEVLCSHHPDTQGIIGSPLLILQVTQFSCGGLSLGLRFNHTITDGKGISLFINCAIELVKGASVPSIPPVWEREVLSARSPPRITCTHNEFQFSSNHQKPHFISSDNQQNLNSTPFPVVFGPKEIQALRDQLTTTDDQIVNATTYSRFELIAACQWKCRTMALEPHPDEDVRISVVVSVRQNNMISLPDGYYGNAIVFPTEISKAGILCGSPLSYALDLIQRAKAQVNEEYIRSFADLMVIKGRHKYFNVWNFIVSDLTKLGFDKIDIPGLGKPSYGGVPWANSDASFFTNFRNDDGEDCIMTPMCLPTFAIDRFQFELKKITT